MQVILREYCFPTYDSFEFVDILKQTTIRQVALYWNSVTVKVIIEYFALRQCLPQKCLHCDSSSEKHFFFQIKTVLGKVSLCSLSTPSSAFVILLKL